MYPSGKTRPQVLISQQTTPKKRKVPVENEGSNKRVASSSSQQSTNKENPKKSIPQVAVKGMDSVQKGDATSKRAGASAIQKLPTQAGGIWRREIQKSKVPVGGTKPIGKTAPTSSQKPSAQAGGVKGVTNTPSQQRPQVGGGTNDNIAKQKGSAEGKEPIPSAARPSNERPPNQAAGGMEDNIQKQNATPGGESPNRRAAGPAIPQPLPLTIPKKKDDGRMQTISGREGTSNMKAVGPSSNPPSSRPVVATENMQKQKPAVGTELTAMKATASISQQRVSQPIPKRMNNGQPQIGPIGAEASNDGVAGFASQTSSSSRGVAVQSFQKRKASFGEDQSNNRGATTGQQPPQHLVLTTKDHLQKRKVSDDMSNKNTNQHSTSPLSSLQSKTPSPPNAVREVSRRPSLLQQVVQQNIVSNQREAQGNIPPILPGAKPSGKLRLRLSDGDGDKEQGSEDETGESQVEKGKAVSKNFNNNGEMVNLPGGRVAQRGHEDQRRLNSPSRRPGAPVQRMWAEQASPSQDRGGHIPHLLYQQARQRGLGRVPPSIPQYPLDSRNLQRAQYLQNFQQRQQPQSFQSRQQPQQYQQPQHSQNVQSPQRLQQYCQRPSVPQQLGRRPQTLQNTQQLQRNQQMQPPQSAQRPQNSQRLPQQTQDRVTMSRTPQPVSQSQTMQHVRSAGQPRPVASSSIQPPQLPPMLPLVPHTPAAALVPQPQRPPKPTSDALSLFGSQVLTRQVEGESPITHATQALEIKASSMLRDLKSSLSKLPPQNAQPDVEIIPRQPRTPAFGDLALGKLQKAKEFIRPDPPLFSSNGVVTRKMGDENKQCCSFCSYECDFGVSDERTWLSVDASQGFCKNCLQDGMGFYEEWSISSQLLDVDEERLVELDSMCNGSVLKESWEDVAKGKDQGKEKETQRRKSTSLVDGLDTTSFQGVQFCAGCPWRQVDVTKARICENCRLEKALIIRHRHRKFLPIVDMAWTESTKLAREANFNSGEKKRELKDRNCMICPGQAMYRCEACPLRLCGDCHTFLGCFCKGWLDNLLYHYHKDHIRNDVKQY